MTLKYFKIEADKKFSRRAKG